MDLCDNVVAHLEACNIAALQELLNQQSVDKLLDLVRELGPLRRAIVFGLLHKGLALRLFEQSGSEVRHDLILAFRHDQKEDVPYSASWFPTGRSQWESIQRRAQIRLSRRSRALPAC